MLKYIHFGKDISIPSFNLLIGIGLIAGLLFFEKDSIKNNIGSNETEKIKTSIIFVFVFGFLGALIFDTVIRGIQLKYDILKSNAGFTFYGGLISGLIVLFIYFLVLKIKFKIGFNILVPTLLISHAFGRAGCFMAGCCYGKPTNSFFGVTFPQDSFPYDEYHSSISIHPTQLYEAFGLLVLFLICIKFISFNSRLTFYLISYGSLRFFIEFFRADYRGTIFYQNVLSPSQVISLFLLLSGVILLVTKKANLSRTVIE